MKKRAPQNLEVRHINFRLKAISTALSPQTLLLLTKVNSRLADTLLLPTLAITDKIQIPIYRGLTEKDSQYYGLSLCRT